MNRKQRRAANADKDRIYYTWAHNVTGCLQNGSFVRQTKHGLGQFMNGDFMGFIDAVPDGMTQVNRTAAEDLLPECCV